jgi:hypothetical protein
MMGQRTPTSSSKMRIFMRGGTTTRGPSPQNIKNTDITDSRVKPRGPADSMKFNLRELKQSKTTMNNTNVTSN